MCSQFDFEQKIMHCWSVVDDIDQYVQSQDTLSEDERQNYLIGLKTIYQVKFDDLFKCFEQYIKTQHKKQNTLPL